MEWCLFPWVSDYSVGEACPFWWVSPHIPLWQRLPCKRPENKKLMDLIWNQCSLFSLFEIAYVGRNTAHGTELLRISCVTAHMYRFSLVINDFLSSGSLTSVNFTSIKSLAFNCFCDTGHKMVGSGFCNFEILAAGDCDGTQKLGNSFSLPLAIFEMADALVLGPLPVFTKLKMKNQSINFNFWQRIDGSQLTYLRANRRWCDDVFFSVDEFQQFLLFFQRIIFSCLIVFDSLLAFIFFQLLCIFSFLCDDVLENCFFVEQKSIFSVEWKGNTVEGNTQKLVEIELNSRHNRITARLQCKWTAIEAFHRIFADALMVRAISRFRCISLLLVVRVNCSGRTISCVTCHCSNFNSNFNCFDQFRWIYWYFSSFFYLFSVTCTARQCQLKSHSLKCHFPFTSVNCSRTPFQPTSDNCASTIETTSDTLNFHNTQLCSISAESSAMRIRLTFYTRKIC